MSHILIIDDVNNQSTNAANGIDLIDVIDVVDGWIIGLGSWSIKYHIIVVYLEVFLHVVLFFFVFRVVGFF